MQHEKLYINKRGLFVRTSYKIFDFLGWWYTNPPLWHSGNNIHLILAKRHENHLVLSVPRYPSVWGTQIYAAEREIA